MNKRENQNSNEVNVSVRRYTHLSNSECKMKGQKIHVKQMPQHETLLADFTWLPPLVLNDDEYGKYQEPSI